MKQTVQAHEEQIEPEIAQAFNDYQLTVLRSNDAAHALGFRPDPQFYEQAGGRNVRLITVLYSIGKRASLDGSRAPRISF